MPNFSTTNSDAARSERAQTPPEHISGGFLRQDEVLALVPISKSTLWRLVGEDKFPRPVKLTPRVTAWRADDLRDWIDRRCGVV